MLFRICVVDLPKNGKEILIADTHKVSSLVYQNLFFLGMAIISLISIPFCLSKKSSEWHDFAMMQVSAPFPVPAMERTSVLGGMAPASVAIITISGATFMPCENLRRTSLIRVFSLQ